MLIISTTLAIRLAISLFIRRLFIKLFSYMPCIRCLVRAVWLWGTVLCGSCLTNVYLQAQSQNFVPNSAERFADSARSSAAAQAFINSPNTPSTLLWKQFETRIQMLCKEFDGVVGAVGVAVLDLTTGQTLAINADTRFPAASTIKLAIVAELFRQHEQSSGGGQTRPPTSGAQYARLTDPYTLKTSDLIAGSDVLAGFTPGITKLTNRDLAALMIITSDNAATNILIDRVGMDNVNALLDNLGCIHTRLQRKMIDLAAARAGRENLATPRDMVRLLEALYDSRVCSKTLNDDLMKLLLADKYCYMRRLLPETVALASKPGWLEGVITESGIIFAPNRPFALSVMTSFVRDERAAEDLIARIAREALGVFESLGRSSEYGRTLR